MPLSLRPNLWFLHHTKANVCVFLLGNAPSQFFPLLAIKWDKVWAIHYLLFLLHSANVCYLYWTCVASLTPAATFLGYNCIAHMVTTLTKINFSFIQQIFTTMSQELCCSVYSQSLKPQRWRKHKQTPESPLNPLHSSKPAGPAACSMSLLSKHSKMGGD